MDGCRTCFFSACCRIADSTCGTRGIMFHTPRTSNFVQTQTVRPDEEIVSFDVVSLFITVSVDLALKVIQSKLESNHTTHTKLTKIVELMEGALEYTRKPKTEEKMHPKPQNRKQNRPKPKTAYKTVYPNRKKK